MNTLIQYTNFRNRHYLKPCAVDAIQKHVSKTASNCASSFLAQEEEFLEVFRAMNKKGMNQIERLFKLRSD